MRHLRTHLQHQQASQEAERRADLLAILSLLWRRAEMVSEEFVGAVNQVDSHLQQAFLALTADTSQPCQCTNDFPRNPGKSLVRRDDETAFCSF